MHWNRHLRWTAPAAAAALLGSCTLLPQPETPRSARPLSENSESDVQALVMDMADEYAAALNEAMLPLTMDPEVDPRGRWVAQAYLRNGAGAAFHVAAGPNPDVALLDMLVLTSLQRWTLERHGLAGVDDDRADAAEARLRAAEADAWAVARRVLSEQQAATLRELIDQWTAENAERRMVSFVRFDEFMDARLQPSGAARAKATGLLRQVGEASAAVDDARLLGERLLWYSGRFPYVIGQQTELTTYQLLDQPELQKTAATLESLQSMSTAIAARVESLDSELRAQQEYFFELLAAERGAAMEQAEAAVNDAAATAIADVDQRLDRQRDEFIGMTFDRFAEERTALLDDITARQDELGGIMIELRDTIATSGDLAKELTGTVDAIDRVVSRFDRDPNDTREPLKMADVRDAAVETGLAAERMTVLLEAADQILLSEVWDDRLGRLDNSTAGLVDRAFWRGVWLVLIFIAGLALVRLIPQRTAAARAPVTPA